MTLTSSLKEAVANRGYRLLIAFSTITFVEAISYSWIEVLLYQTDSPVLSDTWLFGHYTTYHLVLAILVLSMVFGVGFFGSMLYIPGRFRKFLYFAFGNLFLWLVLEDEFTFIFSGSPHTATDWTNWPIGAVDVFHHFVPIWYILAVIATGILWFLGLTLKD